MRQAMTGRSGRLMCGHIMAAQFGRWSISVPDNGPESLDQGPDFSTLEKEEERSWTLSATIEKKDDVWLNGCARLRLEVDFGKSIWKWPSSSISVTVSGTGISIQGKGTPK